MELIYFWGFLSFFFFYLLSACVSAARTQVALPVIGGHRQQLFSDVTKPHSSDETWPRPLMDVPSWRPRIFSPIVAMIVSSRCIRWWTRTRRRCRAPGAPKTNSTILACRRTTCACTTKVSEPPHSLTGSFDGGEKKTLTNLHAAHCTLVVSSHHHREIERERESNSHEITPRLPFRANLLAFGPDVCNGVNFIFDTYKTNRWLAG